MILYNVTCAVDADISSDWLIWMKKVHIPEVIECGLFQNVQINKVISETKETMTYAIQYSCKSIEDLNEYQNSFSMDLQKKHNRRYGDKVSCFRTLLEVIDCF